MKKFMFSAIAMIAFVGSSMASDIAEKEVVIEDLKEVLILESSTFTVESSSTVLEASYGSPSACIQLARNAILSAANEYGLDISRDGAHFQIMMDMYHMIYLDCYNN
ncbi:hypothetical protein [Flavobacterium sp. SM2513]|uniref:hypothetical protein n=1 Tax=Flavobacterium sp. SM2513 TaxID=3424766 RepID=UPI003D7FF3D0